MTTPPPVTPADGPSDPAGYASVTPHGQGPAPYDIQAPMEDLSAAVESANAVTGPRQAAAEAMLDSPAGAGGSSIYDGFHGGGGDGWPADVSP